MKLTRAITSMFTAVMLSGLMLSAPVFASPQNDGSFSALQGVEAQALSADEMQAIQGLISLTNINELTLAITNDPTLDANTKSALLALWGKLAKLDGTKYEFVADAFFLFMRKYKYPTMCGLNADFCSQ